MKTLGPNHPRTHKIMDTLGATRCFQGKFKESLQLHSDAVKRMERVNDTSFIEVLKLYEGSFEKLKEVAITDPEDLFIDRGNFRQDIVARLSIRGG